MPWIYLAVAICSEVLATSCLRSAEGFSRLLPSVAVIAGYGAAFYFLSLALQVIPTGTAYAVWSGAGIVLVALLAWMFQAQKPDAAALAGMALIIAGVIVIGLFSRTRAS